MTKSNSIYKQNRSLSCITKKDTYIQNVDAIIDSLYEIYGGRGDEFGNEGFTHPLIIYTLLPPHAPLSMQVCALLHDVILSTDKDIVFLREKFKLNCHMINDLQTMANLPPLVEFPSDIYYDDYKSNISIITINLCKTLHIMHPDSLEDISEKKGKAEVQILVKKHDALMFDLIPEYIKYPYTTVLAQNIDTFFRRARKQYFTEDEIREWFYESIRRRFGKGISDILSSLQLHVDILENFYNISRFRLGSFSKRSFSMEENCLRVRTDVLDVAIDDSRIIQNYFVTLPQGKKQKKKKTKYYRYLSRYEIYELPKLVL